MPWIQAIKPPGETPARYGVPSWLCISSEEQLEYAKRQRKKIGQLREEILKYQKDAGKIKDIEGARYFREEAAYLMKQYRGFDLAIAWIEGNTPMNTWRFCGASEEIAPYIDLAFGFIDLYTPKT